MSMEDALRSALNGTGVAEVVRITGDDTRLSALCRVHDKKEWVSIVEHVLLNKEGWGAHICQQYFTRGNKVVFGWNFVVQLEGGTSMSDALNNVSELLHAVSGRTVRSRTSVDEFPLVGSSRSRRATSNVQDPRLPGPSRGGPSHKGAYPVVAGD